MKYRSKFQLGKEYYVMNAESALRVLSGEEVAPTLRSVQFEELDTTIVLFGDRIAQHVVASRGENYCDPMDFSDAVSVEDMVILRGEAELEKISSFAKQGNIRTQKLFDLSENEGTEVELPNTIGTKRDGRVIAGFTIKERKASIEVQELMLNEKEWEKFQQAIGRGENEFSIFNLFFLRR